MNSLVRKADNVHFNASPNYSYIFSFEENFDYEWPKSWMIQNWTLSFFFGTIYMVLVFGGQAVMVKRKPLNVRPLLTAWNFALAIFSSVAAIRLYPEFLYMMKNHDFHYSVCDNTSFETNKISGFWLWLFILSKAPELLDTLFIVLRKQKLIFLHWFHHLATLCFTWFIYREHVAIGRWFAFMNLLIHSVMYSYFGLRTIGFKIPRFVAMVITTAQIVQMVLGSWVSVYAYTMHLKGVPCAISQNTGRCAVLIYSIHFYLFVKLFSEAYLNKKSEKSGAKKDKLT